MKNKIKRVLNKLPYIRTLLKEKIMLEKAFFNFRERFETWVPPGHYYSPIPSVDDLNKRKGGIYNHDKVINEINLNKNEQILLLRNFIRFYKDIDFSHEKSPEYRYYYNNPSFKEPDAISLFSFIRYYRPKRIIEIGSGFTSALILDVNEKWFNNSIELTFIEPYPETLFSLICEKEKVGINLKQQQLQDVNLEVFQDLEKNDLLFIDSTHVSRTGSDVNLIFFEIFT